MSRTVSDLPGGGLLAAAADLLLGARCAGCARPGPALCPTCGSGLVARPRLCWPDPPPPVLAGRGVPPYAGADYAGLLRRLVLAYKDDGRAGLKEPLARMLAGVVGHALAETARVDHALADAALADTALADTALADAALADTALAATPPADTAPPARSERVLELVPVPSPRASVRRRGRDPVADVAQAAARALRRRGHHVRVVPRLTHRRTVLDQAGLGAVERRANLSGALGVRGAPAGPARGSRRPEPVVVRMVVDDVVTTGATADECVRVLLAAGWPVAAVAAVAATRRRGQGRAAPTTFESR